jgi:hypothetical protein
MNHLPRLKNLKKAQFEGGLCTLILQANCSWGHCKIVLGYFDLQLRGADEAAAADSDRHLRGEHRLL